MKSLTLAALLLAAPASAHDQWANGEPVPEWVRSSCCGPSDGHHLRPEQVHAVPGGYKFDGYTRVIPQAQVMPSPDGSWWIFYRNYPDGTQSGAFCVFGAEQGS